MLTRLCLAACMLALLTSVSAQSAIESQAPSVQKIQLRKIVFENATLLSAEEQNQISKKLREEDSQDIDHVASADLSGFADEAAERVREAYQDKGYFKANVSAKFKLVTVDPSAKQMDILVKVQDTGQRYWLHDIQWKNMTVFPERQLQDLMPIHSDEPFSRARIAEGLENARQLYESRGYINMTLIPNTKIDEAETTIALEIDVDEGSEFTFGGAAFSGLTSDQIRVALESLTPLRGQPYNSVTLDDIFKRLRPILPSCAKLDHGQQTDIDARNHVVRVFFDFEECTTGWY